MSKFEKYFSDRYIELKPDKKDLAGLLDEQSEYMLIAGDFWGIQSFLFKGLATKNAAKVLRAKSAFVQIYTEVMAKYICHRLGISESHILSIGAGKFEILSPVKDESAIEDVRKKANDYFIERFYGLSGISIVSIECSRSDFEPGKSYRAFRDTVSAEIEKSKFHKFDLRHRDPVLRYDAGIDNQTLCPMCSMRKKEPGSDNCSVCENFIYLGRLLTKKERQHIPSESIGIEFDSFSVEVELEERLKSYIPSNEEGPLDFKTIAEASCKECKNREGKPVGIKSLGILKADVDNMGKYLRESDITESFGNFDLFSKSLDNFFSLYVTRRLREDYRNIYTVFAGGDDLFLVGAWDEIMAFARETEGRFKTFTKGKLTISFGIAIAKPSKPISYLADHTEGLLELSKEFDNEAKDAITIWDMSAGWTDYLSVYNEMTEAFSGFEAINTALLYRLLELCDMSAYINEDMRNTMWKSRLSYLFSRNVDTRYHYLLEPIGRNIEKHPLETKMFLNEFIYKRRD